MTTIYKVFDGAWFNAKYAIENDWKDKHVVLLFPEQVYPHTEEQQLSFPLLDMLKANMEYKEEDYASFMQQYNLLEKFRSFVKKNIGEIMSSKVSNILNGHIDSYCFYITKFKYHLFIHNLPVPIPYVVSVYGGMRLCSVILVFDDYSKLFHYIQPCAVPYNRISMPVSFQSPP